MVFAYFKKRIKKTMKKMLIYLIIICALLVISSVLLDVGYTASFKNDIPRNKVQLVANLKDRHINFVFLGSSRVENHIDCNLITQLTGKSCINLGIQGGTIADSNVMMQMLNLNRVTYDKLLLQVDYMHNINNNSPAFVSQLTPFLRSKRFSKELAKRLTLPKIYDLPFVRYAINEKYNGVREVVLQVFQKESSVDMYSGFNPLMGVGNDISGHFPDEIASSNADLDEILATGDNVVLFTAPYCKNTLNRDEFIEALTIDYPQLKSFVDIFDDEEDNYANCGHLNMEGAQKFTHRITDDILRN
tara:strand:+ start:73673 stop:74581 length:909 start_codon:yes stop_codon:yes gene_type:complete